MKRYFAYTFVLVAIGLLQCSTAAASLSLTLDDGTTSFTVSDGGAGDADGVTNGAITFLNSLQVAGKSFATTEFTFLSISSFSNAPGTTAGAGLNTTTLEFTTSSLAKTLNVIVSDTFSLPGSAGDSLNVINSLTGNHLSGGTASATQVSLLDGTPTPVASVSVSSSLGNINDTDETMAWLPRAGATFTLETDFTTSLPAGTNASFTSVTSAVVPEPATIAVWSALGVIGVLAYRRRQLA